MNAATSTALPRDRPAVVTGEGRSDDEFQQFLYALIERQPFFKGLTPQQLRGLAGAALEMEFKPGQVLFEEGSPANRFYLILKGRVELAAEMEDRNVIPIQTLGPGDDLGWSWLFPPYHTHFSARAMEPTTTLFFYAPRLREQCEADHELGYQIMRRVAAVATLSLGATQRRLMHYIDENTPEKT